jgi:hypothetical protein
MTGGQWKTFYYIKESYVSPTSINVENLEQEYMKIMILWDVMPQSVRHAVSEKRTAYSYP